MAEAQAQILRHDLDAVVDVVPREDSHELRDLTFAEMTDAAAAQVFGRLHYLRHHRYEAVSFALHDNEFRPVVTCSITPMTWRRPLQHLCEQFSVPPEGVVDVARVYAFDSAPRNAISYLLARVREEFKATPAGAPVALFCTTVNPNLGFTGASYRASNWQQALTIRARPFLYLDDQFVTPRQLRVRFGTEKVSELRRLGVDVHSAHRHSEPSLAFASRPDRPTEAVAVRQVKR